MLDTQITAGNVCLHVTVQSLLVKCIDRHLRAERIIIGLQGSEARLQTMTHTHPESCVILQI